MAEYEALLHGMRIAKEMGATRLRCFSDSDLVTSETSGTCDATDANMIAYKRAVDQAGANFAGHVVEWVDRHKNKEADALVLGQAITTTRRLPRHPHPPVGRPRGVHCLYYYDPILGILSRAIAALVMASPLSVLSWLVNVAAATTWPSPRHLAVVFVTVKVLQVETRAECGGGSSGGGASSSSSSSFTSWRR
ncbi:hypothetical protein QYE76_016351 [Lolium multiflorum]|uniref:RNase H type-1 domain-containing protein n=1 Tax=Lolium multiflorum TaxID=4521 RepID=A0AAD8VED1_LOLMU|nr:hypothetical protein QYE76_016351 [Lolium multiflorum]